MMPGVGNVDRLRLIFLRVSFQKMAKRSSSTDAVTQGQEAAWETSEIQIFCELIASTILLEPPTTRATISFASPGKYTARL